MKGRNERELPSLGEGSRVETRETILIVYKYLKGFQFFCKSVSLQPLIEVAAWRSEEAKHLVANGCFLLVIYTSTQSFVFFVGSCTAGDGNKPL